MSSPFPSRLFCLSCLAFVVNNRITVVIGLLAVDFIPIANIEDCFSVGVDNIRY